MILSGCFGNKNNKTSRKTSREITFVPQFLPENAGSIRKGLNHEFHEFTRIVFMIGLSIC